MEKQILIVGGRGGLGEVLAQKFDKSGWKVLILSRKTDRNGGKYPYFRADLRVPSQIRVAAKEINLRFNKLHAVLFCAGVVQDQTLLKLEESHWDEVLQVNLKSSFLLTQLLTPLLGSADGGHLVHLGSIVGLTGRRGQSNYAAAKAGLVALAKSSAKELGSQNIRVNVVLPGFLKTPMTAHLTRKHIEQIYNDNVLGRTGTLEEVAQFVLFLCSTKHISGQVFNLDSRILPTF